MRKTSSLVYQCMLACAFLLLSCQDEEKSPARPGDVCFTIRSRPLDADGARAAVSVLPHEGKLHVTVLKASGEVVFDLKEIPFTMLGDYVISEPLPLAPGDYTVTQFVISSEDDGTYAAPVEGSPVAKWVDDPLPIPFTVSDGALTGVTVEVLPFDDERYTPEDFGYVTFGVGIAPYPYFKVAVFKPGPNGPELAAVQAYLLDGADTLVNTALSPGTHSIAFNGVRSKAYTLVLQDDTYGLYAQSFVLDSLLSRLDGEPWAITMKHALTLVASESLSEENIYGFHLVWWRGSVSIDWGDGTREEHNTTEGVDLQHQYGTTKPQVISITGALEDILSLQIHPWSGTSAVYLEDLTLLMNFSILAPQSPKVIDLRKNTWISTLDVSNSGVESFLLPNNAQLAMVDISNTSFSSAEVNNLVHAVYEARYVQGGVFNLANTTVSPPAFVAPPSAQALAELRFMRDEFQWTISPNDF